MGSRTFELPAAAAKSAVRGGARKVYGAADHSPEKQRELLANYMYLDRAQWGMLKSGDSVRYVTTDGNFRSGGVIHSVSFVNPKAPRAAGEPGRAMISMRSSVSDKSPGWVVPWDTVQDIYYAIPAAVSVLQQSVEANILTIDSNIHKLVAALQKLQASVVDIERRLAAHHPPTRS